MLLALVLLEATAAPGARPALGATTERIVTNLRTGLAIDGFDPVAYFMTMQRGSDGPDFEFRYRGAVWRFAKSR